jgi:hypothetical protein
MHAAGDLRRLVDIRRSPRVLEAAGRVSGTKSCLLRNITSFEISLKLLEHLSTSGERLLVMWE